VQESRTVVVGCSAWRLLFRVVNGDANSVVRKSTHRKAMRSRPIADQRITRRAPPILATAHALENAQGSPALQRVSKNSGMLKRSSSFTWPVAMSGNNLASARADSDTYVTRHSHTHADGDADRDVVDLLEQIAESAPRRASARFAQGAHV
jgi:hypothetical protein